MKKSSFRVLGSQILFLLIIIVIGKYVIVAQSSITGDWRADIRDEKVDSGKIHISFDRSTSKGKNNYGSSYEFEELQGLTPQQAANGGKVSFSLVREAGQIDCEGSFENGKGSGKFRFNPNMSFITAMRSKGFDFETESRRNKESDVTDRLFSAALLNVTSALADDLNSANFGKLDVEDLFKAAIFKIDGKFMAEMKATGFPDLAMEDLVKARIFKIDADYVRQVREMGFGDQGFEGLVKFRIFKVTPEYLAELKAAGLQDLDSEDIVKCRIFKIDPAFIRKAKADNPNITVEELVRIKLGVSRKKDVI